MSKRKRHSAKPIASSQIEWLKHRTGYPTPAERKAIIQLRKELSAELLMLMFTKVEPDSPRAQALSKKYSGEEMERAIEKMEEGMEMPSFIADEARSYRDYRQRYARFGAGLKFFSPKEIDELYKEHAEQLMSDNDNEAGKLLIVGWRDWDDITPPVIPLCPADYVTPAPASYFAPINELLEWGDDLKRSRQFEDEVEYLQWKKYVPALTRMALDPGLLNGWPSEKSSWAPWHAIHALGNLEAWESAPALASLADLENDWLSDHLPHIWADMGVEVEPSLWMILENTSASTKQRGLAVQSLQMLAEENEPIEAKVVKGFEKILQNAKTFDSTLNAYILYYLKEMGALEEIRATIDSAFDQERVDENIFTLDDLEEDDFDDELDDDFDLDDPDLDDLGEDD